MGFFRKLDTSKGKPVLLKDALVRKVVPITDVNLHLSKYITHQLRILILCLILRSILVVILERTLPLRVE